MNLLDAKHQAMALAEAGNAVLFRSESGLGKSSIVYQIFEELKQRDAAKGISWGFGCIFAATQTPPDLIGYQFKGEREFPTGEVQIVDGKEVPVTRKITVTDPSVPLWMISTEGKPAWLYDRFFLLIDEYGQGEADVKRAVAEIFLNGGTAPWYLPKGSIRMACSNDGLRHGVTKDFDFCIARRTVIDVRGDIDVWLRYADKPYMHQGKVWQTQPIVKAWAAAHPEIVFEPAPKEQGPWCNPRALCAADRYLQVMWQGVPQNQQKIDGVIMETLAGTIGMPATQSLAQHLTFRLELPSYDEVVADPLNCPLPTKADLLMLMMYELASYTKVEDMGPVIQYITRKGVPKDMAITFATALLRRDYKNFIGTPAMQAWISKNANLLSMIGTMIN